MDPAPLWEFPASGSTEKEIRVMRVRIEFQCVVDELVDIIRQFEF